MVASLVAIIVKAAVSVFVTVGLIQYVKQLWAAAPDWAWKAALPVLGVLVFVLLSVLSPAVLPWVTGIALVVAGGQLFYEVIVKLFGKLRDWINSLVK